MKPFGRRCCWPAFWSKFVRKLSLKQSLLALLIALVLAGCSSGGRDADVRTSDPLIVPPDLSSERIGEVPALGRQRSATFSEFARGEGRDGAAVLPEPPGMQVQRSGQTRWLRIDARPEEVWVWLNDFAEEFNIPVIRSSESLGVIESDWMPRPLGLSGGVFMPLELEADAPVLEQYTFRLDSGDRADRTLVFVAHRRAMSDNGDWTPRDGDRGREAEALRTFMVHLGINEVMAARDIAAAQEEDAFSRIMRDSDDRLTLVIAESFLQGWRRVGLAIDRAGFTVEDRDRSERLYLVRYDPSAEADRSGRSFFSRLAFWRTREAQLEPGNYAIRLGSDGGSTTVWITDEDGDAVDEGLSEQLLVLIQEQLR
jgi:outer membrane protein assembly factor BamC